MATRSAKIDQKADLIWAIADKLTGVYKRHEYGDVILPLTVIRRFDCILSDTKDLSIISICRSQQLSLILLMADAGMIIPIGRMYLNTVKMAVFRQ